MSSGVVAEVPLTGLFVDQPGVGFDDGLPGIHEAGSFCLLSGTAQEAIYPSAGLTVGEKTVS